jgi:hypothetical protein
MFKRSPIAVAAVLVALFAASTTAQTSPKRGSFKPVDEGGRRPDFAAFRAGLRKTIEAQDVEGLLRVVDPKIHFMVGDETDVDAFKREWGLDKSRSGRNPTFDRGAPTLWQELRTVLRLGGRWQDDGVFVAPYVCTDFGDEPKTAAVIGANVRVRADATAGSPVIVTLRYGTVRFIDYDYYVQRPWTRVELSDGRIGYVNGEYLRASSDFCAYFARRNGKWRMTVFIQPD